MARKRTEIQSIRSDVPVYPIGVAARLLNVHPRTLRIYEQEGLIKPTLVGNRRMFSADDIQRITCLRTFIHEEGISIPGLKKLLNYIPCWEIAGCPAAIHECCLAKVNRATPRSLHQAGDPSV
jgi:MerR family transcriptional regulator/heat shock protein HspR